jgi:glycosyltransferase involved in cell wall biosynthesis
VNPANLSYVLVTPARNEETFIEGTIQSVVAQSVTPARWVIVSDGSTDRTDAIVQAYAGRHPWIELLRLPERRDRQFAAKAHAFNAGYARLAPVAFDLVANLDADITFDPDYCQFLLDRFADNPGLGVAGTPFVEDFDHPDQHSYDHKSADRTHVSGACQMFRRKCFEEVGGYVPIKGGGIDWVAVTTARMKGWQTRTFVDKVCYHHRKMGTAGRGPLRARFRHGQEDYYVGGHPLWELIRGIFQMRERPWVLGGLFLIAGYCWAGLTRMPSPVPADVRRFQRREQMSRLKAFLKRSSHRPASQES